MVTVLLVRPPWVTTTGIAGPPCRDAEVLQTLTPGGGPEVWAAIKKAMRRSLGG